MPYEDETVSRLSYIYNSNPNILNGCRYIEIGPSLYMCLAAYCEQRTPGERFNMKMPSYQNRDPHCGDKTILRYFYHHHGTYYTGKTVSLY